MQNKFKTNNMNEDYVSLETAQLLKEFGFDYRCDYFYNSKTLSLDQGIEYSDCECDNGNTAYVINNWNDGIGCYPTSPEDVICSAPLLYFAQQWLREKKNIHAQATVRGLQGHYVWVIYDHNTFKVFETEENVIFDTYEQALDSAIREACKLIKDK